MSQTTKKKAVDFEKFIGEWEGETKTCFDPSTPWVSGYTKTQFTNLLDGLFVQEKYSGSIGDKSHGGYRILGLDSRLNEVTCYWMDSFHTGPTAMACRGPVKDGRIVFLGAYYGGDEKWGWRTEFQVVADNELHIDHFNITPDGEVSPAIETRLKRIRP